MGAQPRVKATLRLGSETYSVTAVNGESLSGQLVSMKEESMTILKEFITKHNVPTDVPDDLAYGDISFEDCKRASEEAVAIIVKNLQGKLFSDSESIQARAEAAVLLKQLDFPVETLEAKLLEKLEQSLGDVQLKPEDLDSVSEESNDASKQGKDSDAVPVNAHEASVCEFAEAIRAYRVIFPDSEKELIKLAQDLIRKHLETTEQHVKKRISSANLLSVLRIIWTDVLLLMDDVLHEAVLPDFSLEAAQIGVREYIIRTFSHLLQDIPDAVLKVNSRPKDEVKEYSLQAALEGSKKAVLQGSMDVLLNFHHLLEDDDLGLVIKLRDLVMDWVQEGFHDFFRSLDQRFHMLSGRNNALSQDQNLTEDGSHGDKVLPGLVLVLAQLSIFIEQTVISRITEQIAASFSGGAGEKLLHHYIKMRTHRISILLRKRFTTPNWIKHREPREVHMFIDLFLQEVSIGNEVKQISPQGYLRKHRRSDSNGNTTSSRSNPLRDDKMSKSNTQRPRSQLLETHLAKLFKLKVEIFTKVELTQEYVVTTIVKLCLKSLQQFVRLQTINRSGFQQIQLDIQFLRTPLKETAEDETAIDFLLDEVIVAASERCLDPIPLEPPILDKLIQAKLAKSK
ncbi:hypothetical protein SLE2022_335450 [Rubroshorea leprosula]